MVLFFEINKKLEPLSWVHDHDMGRYYRASEHNKNSDGDGYCPLFLKGVPVFEFTEYME